MGCGALVTASVDRNAITNPIVVVEISSPGTEAYDRGAKMDHYRRLVSLREYVLVNHDRHQVEVFRRNEAGRFEQFVFGAGEAVALAPPTVRSRPSPCRPRPQHLHRNALKRARATDPVPVADVRAPRTSGVARPPPPVGLSGCGRSKRHAAVWRERAQRPLLAVS